MPVHGIYLNNQEKIWIVKPIWILIPKISYQMDTHIKQLVLLVSRVTAQRITDRAFIKKQMAK